MIRLLKQTRAQVRARNDQGVTLAEIAIVIIVVGILAAIGVGGYNFFINRAQTAVIDSQATAAARIVNAAVQGGNTVNTQALLTDWSNETGRENMAADSNNSSKTEPNVFITLQPNSYFLQPILKGDAADAGAPPQNSNVIGAPGTVTSNVRSGATNAKPPTVPWATTVYRLVITGEAVTDWRCALIVGNADGTKHKPALAPTTQADRALGVWYQTSRSSTRTADQACSPVGTATACDEDIAEKPKTGAATVSCISIPDKHFQFSADPNEVLSRNL